MISESIYKECEHELAVCQHLFTKLDPNKADWRPHENMRSTLELLQYLAYIGGAMTRHFTDPLEDRDAARERYRASARESKSLTFEQFPETIEREKKALYEIFCRIKDSDLTRISYHPFAGEDITLFEGLMIVVRYLCAYRHQLFLYAKMCGAEINTRNNWYGMDATAR